MHCNASGTSSEEHTMTNTDSLPATETLYRPIMEALREHPGLHARTQIPDAVADALGLTEEQRTESYGPYSAEKRTKHQKNTDFALSALRQLGMAENDSTGHWSLTPDGERFLESGLRTDEESMRGFVRDAARNGTAPDVRGGGRKLVLDISEREAVLACCRGDADGDVALEWRESLFNPIADRVFDAYPYRADRTELTGFFLDAVRRTASSHGMDGHLEIVVVNTIPDEDTETSDGFVRMAEERDIEPVFIDPCIADALSVPGNGKVLVIDQRYDYLTAATMDLEDDGVNVTGMHMTDYGWSRVQTVLRQIVVAANSAVHEKQGMDTGADLRTLTEEAAESIGSILSGQEDSIRIKAGKTKFTFEMPKDVVRSALDPKKVRFIKSSMHNTPAIERKELRSADRIIIAGTNGAMNDIREQILDALPDLDGRVHMDRPWEGTLIGAARFGFKYDTEESD